MRCDVLVTENHFGLPIYRWAPQTEALEDMRARWADGARQSKHARLMGYSLGKAHRLVAGLATAEAPDPADRIDAPLADWMHRRVLPLRQSDAAARRDRRPQRPARPVLSVAPLQAEPEAPGERGAWQAEWKYDGIHAQVVKCGGQVRIWSCSEGAVTLRLRLGIATSPLVDAADWPGLATAREGSREPRVEGLMPKHCDSAYDIGRTGSAWWKVAPLSVDAALIYALAGHGRRANLYTDYSFAVWNRVMPAALDATGTAGGEPALGPFASRAAHLGLTSLLPWRAGRNTPATFTMAITDHGPELLSATPIDWAGRLRT